jgi:hypothetical protein
LIKIFKIADLNTNLLYSDKLIQVLKSFFGIDILGFYFDNNICIYGKQEHIILRKNFDSLNSSSMKDISNNKNFILYSSVFKGSVDDNFYNSDILTVKNLHNIKSLFKKYNGKNMGLEFLISDIRNRDDIDLGKWFFDVKWVYELCKKYNFQFILSSGANRCFDLISLKIFNTILKRIGIENRQYWSDLTVWLDNKKITYSL